MIETIEETAVGILGSQRVPMANPTPHYKFQLADGSEAAGPACMLILPEGARWVGVGSEIVVGGYRWRVIKLHVPADDSGSVSLKRLAKA